MRDETTGRFTPGHSGNPTGRPVGSGKIAELRRRLDDNIEGILAVVDQAARRGDLQACRLLLERSIPPYRADQRPEPVPIPAGSLTDKGRAILQGVADGAISPSAAAELLTALGGMAKLAEHDEVERRLAQIEARLKTEDDEA